MTPFSIALMAGIFSVLLLGIMFGLFFFSISFGRKKKNNTKFEQLLNRYEKLYCTVPEIENTIPYTAILQEKMLASIKKGELIKAKHLSFAIGELSDEDDFCPLELKEVLLPDIIRINKPFTPELFVENIAHHYIRSPLTPLFASISRPLLKLKSQTVFDFGLTPDLKASNHQELEPVLGALSRISKLVLNFEPNLYYKKDEHILHALTSNMGQWYPSIITGKSFLELSENKQLFFLVSKLALFRPELRILLLYPTEKSFSKFGKELIKYWKTSESHLMDTIFKGLENSEVKDIKDYVSSISDLSVEDLITWRKGALLTTKRIAWVIVDRWKEIKEILEEQNDEETKKDLLDYMIKDKFIDIYRKLGVI